MAERRNSSRNVFQVIHTDNSRITNAMSPDPEVAIAERATKKNFAYSNVHLD